MTENQNNPPEPQPNFVNPANPEFSQRNPFVGKLLSSKRLTASDWDQDVREYRIELHPSMKFNPGDALAILPSNPPHVTSQFLQRVNIPPNLIITSLQPRDECSCSHMFP